MKFLYKKILDLRFVHLTFVLIFTYSLIVQADDTNVIYNKKSGKVLSVGKSEYINWQKIDDTSSAITYTGDWGTFVGNAGFKSTEHFSK